MKTLVPKLVELLSKLPWPTIIAIAVAVCGIAYVLTLTSCQVARKTTTYGVTKSEYVKYDTITTKSSAKVPKTFKYVE